MFYIFFIFKLSVFFCYDIIKLNVTLIDSFDKEKAILFIIYLNTSNNTQLNLLNELSNYKNKYSNITFCFIDTKTDIRLIKYFNLKNTNDSGIIIYNFKNNNFYVHEEILNGKNIENILNNLNLNKINWNTNSIIERLLYFITGKRYGKSGDIYFSIILLIFSLFVFCMVKKKKKKMKQKKTKIIIKFYFNYLFEKYFSINKIKK